MTSLVELPSNAGWVTRLVPLLWAVRWLQQA
jgi:hypothetical protein